MRRYALTLLLLWPAGALAARWYARAEEIPAGVAIPVALALLLELSLYAALAFQETRDRIARLGRWLPSALIASAAVPYLVYAWPTGMFDVRALGELLALAGAASAWYYVLPHRRIADAAFLVFMAAVVLARLFDRIYASPVDGLDVQILGHLLWIRLGITALLLVRRLDGIGFGFWPSRREWLIGLRQFAILLPLAAALLYGLDFARLNLDAAPWGMAPFTFFGILWVVALSEEFFFRGLLLRWLADWLGTVPGLVIASLAFGAVHLSFREFPNWRFAALAALAGLFYGRAYLQGNGIRAAMVTHALMVTTWRTLFR